MLLLKKFVTLILNIVFFLLEMINLSATKTNFKIVLRLITLYILILKNLRVFLNIYFHIAASVCNE